MAHAFRSWKFGARLMAVCLAGAVLVGCGGPKEDPRNQTRDGVTMQFSTTPSPPKVGLDTDFALNLTEGGQPLQRATVGMVTEYRSMHQPGPSAIMDEISPGRYEAPGLTTGMNGSWVAKFTVRRRGKEDIKYEVPFSVAK